MLPNTHIPQITAPQFDQNNTFYLVYDLNLRIQSNQPPFFPPFFHLMSKLKSHTFFLIFLLKVIGVSSAKLCSEDFCLQEFFLLNFIFFTYWSRILSSLLTLFHIAKGFTEFMINLIDIQLGGVTLSFDISCLKLQVKYLVRDC